jgi:DNA-binding NarL/FixJ family response regulator
MTGKRILLADDVLSVLHEVARLLQEKFEIVAMVSDGQAALESTLSLNPDLVVLDISMPGLSGIEVARELTKLGNSPKIVFLTVHEDADILAACLDAGGAGYVIKIMMEMDLIPAIDAALAGRKFVSRMPSDFPTGE